MAISILLADDHDIFRQGLQMLLSAQPEFNVIGQAKDGLEAIRLTEQLMPDLAIIDMMMPGLNGLDAVLQIKQIHPSCKTIILSLYQDESYVINALKYGVNGYVLKDSSATDLVKAIHTAIEGRRFLSPRLEERAIEVYINHANMTNSNNYQSLTNREREVFHLTVDGLTGPQIAKRLSISIRTVETHKANMMHKLNLRSQADLIRYAIENKIIPANQVNIP